MKFKQWQGREDEQLWIEVVFGVEKCKGIFDVHKSLRTCESACVVTVANEIHRIDEEFACVAHLEDFFGAGAASFELLLQEQVSALYVVLFLLPHGGVQHLLVLFVPRRQRLLQNARVARFLRL